MKILLIRHGKTVANEKHLYCGSTDLPLSEQGRRELAGKKLSAPENCRYYSSGMRRADETLELLFPVVEYEREPGFRGYAQQLNALLRLDFSTAPLFG